VYLHPHYTHITYTHITYTHVTVENTFYSLSPPSPQFLQSTAAKAFTITPVLSGSFFLNRCRDNSLSACKCANAILILHVNSLLPTHTNTRTQQTITNTRTDTNTHAHPLLQYTNSHKTRTHNPSCVHTHKQATSHEAIHARLLASQQQLQHLTAQNHKLAAANEEMSTQLQDTSTMATKVCACVYWCGMCIRRMCYWFQSNAKVAFIFRASRPLSSGTAVECYSSLVVQQYSVTTIFVVHVRAWHFHFAPLVLVCLVHPCMCIINHMIFDQVAAQLAWKSM